MGKKHNVNGETFILKRNYGGKGSCALCIFGPQAWDRCTPHTHNICQDRPNRHLVPYFKEEEDKDCGVWSLDCDLCDVTGPRSETKEGAAIAWNNRKKTEVEE